MWALKVHLAKMNVVARIRQVFEAGHSISHVC